MIRRRSLLLLLLAHLLVGLLYAGATPVFEASDEIWHYPVVLELAAGRLPVQEPGVETRWMQEGSQPPLYYALAAALTGWIDASDYETQAILNPFPKIGIPGARDNINLVAHPPGQGPRQGGAVLAVFLIRWLSVLMGTATVYFTYRLAEALAPGRPSLALLAAALAAFNPMALFIRGSVNNDNLLNLLTTIGLWLIIRAMQAAGEGPSGEGEETLRAQRLLGARGDSPFWRLHVLRARLVNSVSAPGFGSAVRLGVVIGLAALTKVSGAVLLPVAALAILLAAARTRAWGEALRRLAGLGAAAGIIAGWWYLRNLLLYGEWVGLQSMALIAGPRPDGFGLADLAAEWSSFWYSFWGVFGAFNIVAPAWYFTLVNALTLLAAAGGLLAFAQRNREGPGDSNRKERKENRSGFTTEGTEDTEREEKRGVSALGANSGAACGLPKRTIHALLLLFLLFTFAGIVRWTLLTPASQGRLMFGGLAPLSFYLAAGLLAWVPAARQTLAARGFALLLALTAVLLPVLTILPAYRPAAPVAALPAEAIPLDVRFGEAIHLVGYRPEQATTLAGEPLPITLYWTADRPIDAAYEVALNGFAYELENVAKLDTWPGGGLRPTLSWQPGDIYPDRYLIPTDPQAQTPTLLRLGVGVGLDTLDEARRTGLPFFQNGQPVDAILLDAGGLVGRPAAMVPPPPARLAVFDHGILLHSLESVWQPDRLEVTLEWSGAEPIPADYTIFVHLFDAGGQRVAQGDASPRRGYWPTSRWRPGEAVQSFHTLILPADLPSGAYTLAVGMYDPITVQRLAAYRPTGEVWQDWAVVIEVRSEK